jgi:hypothetical protein
MALKWFKYNTDHGDIIVDAQVAMFTGLEANEQQVQFDFDRPIEIQPWYLYRWDGSAVVAVDSTQQGEDQIRGYLTSAGISPNPINSTTFTVSSGSSYPTGVTLKSLIAIVKEELVVNNITAVGTIDPGNVSTFDANLINGNLNDFCYNNSSAGSADKELPAMDLGSPVEVGIISVVWFSATYASNDFGIEASNDGTNWTTVVDNLSWGGTPNVEDRFVIPAGNSFRYWRLRCNVGLNASFFIIREMIAQQNAGTRLVNLMEGDVVELQANDVDSELVVVNNSGRDYNITITYI